MTRGQPVKDRTTATGGTARSMTITLVGNLFPPVVALASGPILAQSLGVDGRGAVAAATAPLGLAIALMTFGVPEAVSYAVARHPRLVRTAARNGALIVVLAGLLATAAVFAAREWLSGGDPEIRHLMAVASLAVLPTLLLGVLRGIASGLQRWAMVAWEKVLASALRLAVLVPLWLTDHLTPFTATVVLAVMPVMGALAYVTLPRRLPPGEPDTEHLASTRALTGYGLRLWIGTISGILLSRVDQTIMTPLSSAYQLGLYVVAVNVSELPLVIHRAVRDVTFVTDAHRSEDSRLAAAARISTLICTVVAIGLGATMAWWLPLLFGAEFGPAVPIAWLLLVAVVVSTPGSIAGAGLSARGRPGLRSIALVIACVLNIGLLVLLVPTYGAMGAAWATLLGYVVSSGLNQLFLRRLFGVSMLSFYGVRRSDLTILRAYAGSVAGALTRRGRR
ncbi:flippase [Cellulomonas fimi]|uniref:Polysaccharide biosynthesis protein n=1 Tax=Cellulomonas fimi (strain ATCC 484 / DSM 20113 / JCM 1341 / CCUG 24087 / LMG 16345 / NBRC 15513 / NCIMB 8980 / NCTC 7547 / NRS-133) TaxID=590998 RepID=F4GYN6_CELFA|nr:flippase [Cellulomonas fimi]AEE47153.1 polysaccharide biosynthesis protein [Cellulomonas fimi ATCC 484]NNH07710.1 flippase [Cellulomonas fimi]VEH35421.1 Polysaccharide biosynthesis protein [Cellulomonas fimi]